jgi:UDP-N-acetylmuramoyl-tripeptide--D-alanyl-D-alanine ligase
LTLWTGDAAGIAMGAQRSGPERAISGISIDTRTLVEGDLFFAIQGDARDGHDFVSAALSKGAAGAVIAKTRLAEFQGQGTLYAVDDVLQALVDLGRAARARSHARIVAVTGSVGKTGTKEALKTLLSQQGRAHASVASYNNHWGVPLTLARMPADADFGIFEIGMNHAREISPLTQMVKPHVAVITAIAPVHLENLGSLAAIADAKGEIFDGLQPQGTAIIPADSEFCDRLAALAHKAQAAMIYRFGESRDADPRLTAITLHEDGSEADIDFQGERYSVRFGSPGRHTALNGLAVLAAVKALGGNVAQAIHDLAYVTPPSGRGQRFALGPITLIDESYNANPASMRAALSVLGCLQSKGRKIAILGDMLELGPDEIEMHRDLAPELTAHGVDVLFCAGRRMRALFDALPAHQRGAWAADAEALTPILLDSVRDGDALMIKGSNSSRMSHVVRALKDHFAPMQRAGEN